MNWQVLGSINETGENIPDKWDIFDTEGNTITDNACLDLPTAEMIVDAHNGKEATTPEPASVNEMFCDIMKDKKIKRIELARRLNVTRAFVSIALNDRSYNWTVETIAKWAEALGCKIRLRIESQEQI